MIGITKTIHSGDEMITKTFQSGKRLGHYNLVHVYVYVLVSSGINKRYKFVG